jgi:TPR repeat protein
MLSTLLLPAAEADLPVSQYNIGYIFEYGEGVEANPTEALKWYQKGILLLIL